MAGAGAGAEAEEVTAAELGGGLAVRPGAVWRDWGGWDPHTVSAKTVDAAVGVAGAHADLLG